MSAQQKRGAELQLHTASKYEMARDGGCVNPERPIHTDVSMSIAGHTIAKFMTTNVGDFKCTKVLTLNTMPPSKHGVSAMLAKTLGHIKFQSHISKGEQLRAMERFAMRSGFFNGMLLDEVTPEKIRYTNTFKWRRDTLTSCSKRIMGCMDVVGNPGSYARPDITLRVTEDIRKAALALYSNFEEMRQRVVQSGQSAFYCTSEAERAQLCRYLREYTSVETAWKIASRSPCTNNKLYAELVL